MNRSKAFLFATLPAIFVMAMTPVSTSACSRSRPFSFNELFAADAIVRATAVKYVSRPIPLVGNALWPNSTVEFKVEEVFRGENTLERIVLHGELSDHDDYNDVKIPYTFVRPGGRHGNCYAYEYKQGASFLLFLKKTKDGYTPYFSPLGPSNEQLHESGDAWLGWVKDYLKTHPIQS